MVAGMRTAVVTGAGGGLGRTIAVMWDARRRQRNYKRQIESGFWSD